MSNKIVTAIQVKDEASSNIKKIEQALHHYQISNKALYTEQKNFKTKAINEQKQYTKEMTRLRSDDTAAKAELTVAKKSQSKLQVTLEKKLKAQKKHQEEIEKLSRVTSKKDQSTDIFKKKIAKEKTLQDKHLKDVKAYQTELGQIEATVRKKQASVDSITTAKRVEKDRHTDAVAAQNLRKVFVEQQIANNNKSIKSLNNKRIKEKEIYDKSIVDLRNYHQQLRKPQEDIGREALQKRLTQYKQNKAILAKELSDEKSTKANKLALQKQYQQRDEAIINSYMERKETKRNQEAADEINDLIKQNKQKELIDKQKQDYKSTYINTAATNKYEQAIKKLNHQKQIGAISQKQYNSALIKEKSNHKLAELAARQHAKSTENLANQTIRYLRWAGTIAGVLYATKRAWDATLGIGIQVNKMMEDNTSGIAALLSANTQMTLSNGQVVNSYEKFKIGQQVATQTMEDLRKASIKTYATFPQLTEIFQQAIGQTLSMGAAFGSTVDEITGNTIKLSQRMSNIAGAIGMPMDRAKEEIRSLLSANASTDSLIATMIFGSPGEANKAIRSAKDKGKDGLTQLLDSVLAPFDALQNVESYTRSLLQLEDAWSQLWQTASQPLFESLKDTFKDLAEDINEAKESLIEFRAHVNTINDIQAEAGVKIWGIQLKQVRGELKKLEKDGLSWWQNEKQYHQDLANRKWQILELEKKINLEKSRKSPDLQTKPAFDIKFLEKLEKDLYNSTSKTFKLKQEIEKIDSEKVLHQESIAKNQEAYAKDLATQKILDSQMLASKNAIATLDEAKLKNTKEIAQIELEAQQKQLKAEQEVYVAKQKALGVEVQQSEISMWKLNSLGEQLAIEDNMLDMLKLEKMMWAEVYRYNQAITKEKEKQEKINTAPELDFSFAEIEDPYESILESQLKLLNATQDWGIELEGTAKTLQTLSKSISAVAALDIAAKKESYSLESKYIKDSVKVQEALIKQLEKKYITESQRTELVSAAEKKQNNLYENYVTSEDALNTQNFANQLQGYSQVAGAIGNMYEEGSSGAKAAQAAQAALAVVEGGLAIVHAMTAGDPYTAVARALAVAAVVSQAIGSFGGISGDSSGIESAIAISQMGTNTGTGSVLGDTKAVTESIINSLDILEDYAKPEYLLLSQMTRSLNSIENSLVGLSSNIIRSDGYASGSGFQSTALATANIGSGSTGDSIASTIDGLSYGLINLSLLGRVTSSAMEDLFGSGTTMMTALTDSGFSFADQTLGEAMADLMIRQYQTALTVIQTDGGWLGDSGTTYLINKSFEEVSDLTSNQFSLLLSSMYNSVLSAGTILDISERELLRKLENFELELGNISLHKKSSEEVTELLSAVFGEAFDGMAGAAIAGLADFQLVGEGLAETMSRLAVGISEYDYLLDRTAYNLKSLNYLEIEMKTGDIALEAYRQSILSLEDSIVGAGDGLSEIVDTFNGAAYELFELYTGLTLFRDQLAFLDHDIAGLTSSMIRGAGGTEALTSSMDSYFENFLSDTDQLTQDTEAMTKQFEMLGRTLPDSKESFTLLLNSMDLTTDVGQELYGRILLLSDGFSDLADEIDEAFLDRLEEQAYVVNLQTQAQEELTATIYSSLQATTAFADSLRDLAFTAREDAFQTSMIGMTDQEKEFNYLVDAAKGREEFYDTLSAGGDIADIKRAYDQMVSGYKGATGINEDYASSLSGALMEASQQLFDAEEILRVQIVGVASDVDLGLTQEQLEALGLEDANITQISSIEDYLAELVRLQQETIESNTRAFSTESYGVGYSLGSQEELDFMTSTQLGSGEASALYDAINKMEYITSNNDTADLLSLMGGQGGMVEQGDSYRAIEGLYGSGLLTGDMGTAFEANQARLSAYQNAMTTYQTEVATAQAIYESAKLSAGTIDDTAWNTYDTSKLVYDTALIAYNEAISYNSKPINKLRNRTMEVPTVPNEPIMPTATSYPEMETIQIPAFAEGGIVTSPTMGLIGEAGYSEAVIPLKNPNDPLGQKEVIAELKNIITELQQAKVISNSQQETLSDSYDVQVVTMESNSSQEYVA